MRMQSAGTATGSAQSISPPAANIIRLVSTNGQNPGLAPAAAPAVLLPLPRVDAAAAAAAVTVANGGGRRRLMCGWASLA